MLLDSKNILIHIPSLRAGGGNRLMIRLANYLAVRNRVTIFTTKIEKKDIKYEISQNIKIEEYKSFVFLSIMFYVKRFEMKIISDPISTLLNIIFRDRSIVRFVQADEYNLYNHHPKMNCITKLIFKTLIIHSYRYFNLIFNSTFSFESCSKYLKSSCLKNTVVNPGIELDQFKPTVSYQERTSAVTFYLVKIKSKGYLDCIDLINQILQSETQVSQINIITQDDSFAFTDKRVKIFQPKSDEEISDILNQSKVFISCSWSEGFGLTQLEAMACGNCLLSIDNGGISEYGTNGINCKVYQRDEFKNILKDLNSLLNNNCLGELISNCATKTAQKFSMNKFLNAFEKELLNFNA